MTGQLTEADVDRLYAERKYAEIDAAREAGRLDQLLGVPDADRKVMDRARHGRIDNDDAAALIRLRRHDLVDLARTESRITYTDDKDTDS